MLTSGSISNWMSEAKPLLPHTLQVISIDNEGLKLNCGDLLKIKLSDGEFYADAYTSLNEPFQLLSILKVYQLITKSSSLGKFLKILDYQVVENPSVIIGRPTAYIKITSTDILDPSCFSIVQCKTCKNIISHSGYFINGTNFSYSINCRANSRAAVKCECGVEIGQMHKYLCLTEAEIIVTKFPVQILQSYENFANELIETQVKLEELKEGQSEVMLSYEKRMRDIERLVEGLAAVSEIITRKKCE